MLIKPIELGFVFRGTISKDYFLLGLSWNNLMKSNLAHYWCIFMVVGVSKNFLKGFSGHRPPISFVKNFPIFKEVNKLF